MIQTAQVKRIIAEGVAEVSVTRQGACSHNCSECGGCSTAVLPTVTAMAENTVGAKLGDMVLLETDSGRLLGIAALVYLLPMAMLIFGYLLGQGLGLDTGLCILFGLGFFVLSMGFTLLLDRFIKAHRTFQFHIVQVKTV